MNIHIPSILALSWFGLSLLTYVSAQTEPVTVTEWDQFADSGITAAGPAMESLITQCEQELPGVQIERTIVPSIGIRESYRLAATAKEVPDLAYTWPAASVLAGYAKNDVIAPISAYKQEYGWDWLNPFYIGRSSYQGELYAIPLEQDLVGVYYNQDIFEQLGLEVPTTYDEFLQVADAVKNAGYIPIAFGNRDRWPATNLFSLLMGLTSGREAEEKLLFGDAAWTEPQFLTAAQTFVDWADRGYLPLGFNAIGYDEANALFNQGQAAMNIGGTWVIQDIARNAQGSIGVFMLPPITEGVPAGTVWGEGSQWQVAASTSEAERDAAVAALDCLVSPDKRQTWVEQGYLVPVGTTADELEGWEAPQLVKDFYQEGLETADTNFYDLHTTIPESTTQTLYAELQSLLGKQATPEEFLGRIQASWEAALENGERWIP